LHLAGFVARRALLGTLARTCALLGYCGLASAGGRYHRRCGVARARRKVRNLSFIALNASASALINLSSAQVRVTVFLLGGNGRLHRDGR